MKITVVCPYCFYDIIYNNEDDIDIDINVNGDSLACKNCGEGFILLAAQKNDYKNLRYKAVYSNE